MAKKANRPTNTNYQDFVLDFSDVDLSEYMSEPQQEESQGTLSKIGYGLGAIAKGATLLPMQVADTIRDVYRGGDLDVTDIEGLKARRARDEERAAYVKEYQGKAPEGLADAMNSIGYSLATLGASLGAGAVGALAGPVGAGAAGMAASGTVAYRATKQDFLRRQVLEKTEQVLGRMPTQEEWDRIAEDFDSEATRYGLWEAGPEALSNLFMAKLFGPLGKGMFKSGLGQGVKRGIGLYGEEFATEAVTEMGQRHEEVRAGLEDEEIGPWEAFKKVAPATFWQTTLMAGGKKAADMAANRMNRRAEEVENNLDPDGVPVETDAQDAPAAPPSLEGRAPMLALPPGQDTIYAGTEQAGRGPISDRPSTGSKPERGASAEFIRPMEGIGILDSSLGEGQTIDLLSHDGTSWSANNAVTESLEQEHAPVAPSPTAAQGAQEWSAQEWMDAFESAELAARGDRPDPGMSEMRGIGLPQQSAPSAPTPVAQAPTAAQATNTQEAPRADTMQQASALGIPAPDPMSIPEMPAAPAQGTPIQAGPAGPATSQAPAASSAPREVRPAAAPAPSTPTSRSRVSATPESSDAAPMTREEAKKELSAAPRSELLEMFEGEARWHARRMSKPQMVQALLERHYQDENFIAPTEQETVTPAMEAAPAESGEKAPLPPETDMVESSKENQENANEPVEKHDDGSGSQGRSDGGGLQEGHPVRGLPDGRSTGNRVEGSSGRDAQEGSGGRRKTRVAVPGRDKLDVSYELIEAEDVQASHLPLRDFQKNQNYKLENERRYHDEPAGRDKVNENASRLDPDLLLDAPDANQGAPVVDHEGNVLGGNGRAMSIQKAYESFPGRGETYRAALAVNAERLGLDPAAVSGMKRPMLVRRLDDKPSREERQRLVSSLNEDFTHSREKRADSKSRGDRLSARTIQALAEGLRDADSLRAYFDTSESVALVDMLISDGVIQNTERAAYVGADGLLNPDGKTLVESALRGRIARSYETLAGLPAAIVGKLDAAIPHILIAEGVGGAWNITEDVRDAVDLLAGFARSGQKDASVYLGQVDMMSGKAPIETSSRKALAIFHAALDKKKGEFAAAFVKYASDAKISPEAGGLPGLVKGPDESLTGAVGGQTQTETKKTEEKPSEPAEAPSADAGPVVESKPDTPEQKGIALKLGERIGGSRADTAQKTGAKAKTSKDETPAWRKRFTVGQDVDSGKWRIRNAVTGRLVSYVSFDSAEQAEAMVPVAAVAVKHGVRSSDNGTYKIVRMVTDKKRATIKDGFASEEDAKRYMVEHAVEILETRTGLGEEILAAPENVYRQGTPRRKGDIAPQNFLDDFGFRGAEFGKWNNQDERQELLNHAYDALMDLADILNIPPKALSLNGELGIAFGARGQGLSGAKAHYEPTYAVINLTKMSGAGSLAHEWLHALDNYLARQDGKVSSEKKPNKRGDMVYPDDSERKTMASHGFSTRNSGTREAVRDAYSKLVQSMFTKAEQYVEDTKKAEAFVGSARNALADELKSLRNNLTQDFAAKYGTKRFGAPATPEQLAVFDGLAERLVNGEDLKIEMRQNEGSKSRYGSYRYSNDLLDGISAVYKSVRGRSGFTSDQKGSLDVAASRVRHYASRVAVLESANRADTKTKNVPTGYRMEARKLDEGRTGDYWGTEHEMLARAFSSYIEDKAAAKGIQTDFLVYGANNDMAAFKILGVRPYPEGAERTAINKGFDELFETLEARETDKGVALASLRKGDGEVVGTISKEIARHLPQGKAGDIRLTQEAVKHIENTRLKDLRRLGFEDARGFVQYVLDNADAIYPGSARRDLALVVRAGAPWKQAVIKLEYSEEGDFYRVKTAGPVRSDFFKKKSSLWERAQSKHFQSGESGAVNTTAKAKPQQNGTPRASTESTSGDTGQSEPSVEKDTASEAKVKAAPGAHLPAKPSGRGLRIAAVKRVTDAFGRRAKNAAPVQVVQSFGDLPASIRKAFSGNESDVEAAYDPKTETVWFVADNLTNPGRVAEVWMHEQVVHHGLRSMLSEAERKKLLSQLWSSLGGMNNARIKETASSRGLNPKTNESERQTVMEEVIASMAEKRQAGNMTAQDAKLWKKIVNAILRAWKATVQAVSGREARMAYENIDSLLTALGRHVMDGERADLNQQADNDAAPLASLGGTVQKVLEKAGQKQGGKRDLSGISKKEIADSPALAEALSKIGITKPTLAEKIADAKTNWKRTLEQGLFDRFASIKDYSETGYKMARMTTGIGSQLNSLMVSGAPVWRDNAAAADGKSLYEVFDPVSGEIDRFLNWMVGRRASRLKSEGRENLFTEKDIASLIELGQGKTADGKDRAKVYAGVFNDLAEFKKKVLDFAQEGGIIDPESRKVWENADYIPFYRVQERLDGTAATGGKNKKGITGQDAGIRELKGGVENLGDPLENLLQNFTHLMDAAQKNRTAIQVFQDMHKAGMAERLTTERTQARLKEDSIELAEALEADNLLSGLSDEQKKSLLSVFAVRRDVDSSRSRDGGVVYARWQGRPYLFKVSDPLLYRALTGMNDRGDSGILMKTGRKFKRLLTAGVTSMPDFIVRNFLRDTLHAWAVEHKSGIKPLTSSLKGLKKTLQMDETTRQLYASGATFMGAGFRLGHDPGAARLTLERILAKSRINKEGFFSTVLDDPKKLSEFATLAWEKYEELSGAGENAVRHQIYEKMREKGYSHLDASFAAKDIMDFSMRGEFAFIRTLTELVPFMGARITGLQRLGKGAMEDPRAFAVKGGMVAMASVGLYMINQMFNKADWDDLEDWDKDTYYHFWIGGKHFRLPKPFEVGFIFGTIPERMTEQAMTDAPLSVLWGRVFHGLADQLAMDPTPQAVKPIVEQIANRDLFRDRPIVGMALEKRLPVKQYTARTSMTARMFADAMDALLTPVIGKTGADALRSPVRLEHLVNGYFGGMGSTALGMSDHVMRWLRDEPAMPDGRGPEDWPFVRAFYRGDSSSPQRTKLERELYDSMREADSLFSSLKMLRDTGDVAGEKALRKDAGKKGELLLRHRSALNRLRRQLSGFNRQIDAVYHDRSLNGSQKRVKIDGIQARKNAMAKAEWEKIRRGMKRLQ